MNIKTEFVNYRLEFKEQVNKIFTLNEENLNLKKYNEV